MVVKKLPNSTGMYELNLIIGANSKFVNKTKEQVEAENPGVRVQSILEAVVENGKPGLIESNVIMSGCLVCLVSDNGKMLKEIKRNEPHPKEGLLILNFEGAGKPRIARL